MPRPGPRPYECLKKAWHSDRHQPMRGSLIQEIFRVVNEIHNSETKKNKEWQEKLPVVVLKAEEIIYSKANSEAEYMDLTTLWERTNDAIDTIIRREDTSEAGDLLQPCIEAALILGCTARRASRSQRNSNPRSYLHPTTQETTPPAPLRPHSALRINNPAPPPAYSSTCTTRSIPINSTQLHHYNPTISHLIPYPSQSAIHSLEFQQPLPTNYPLYYAAQNQTTDPHLPYATVSTPTHCIRNPNEKIALHKFFSCDGVVNASSSNPETNLTTKPPNIECDLSLTLGSLSVPSGARYSKCVYEVHNNRSTTQQGSKQLCFFPSENSNEPLESSSSKWSSKGEGMDLDGSSRKRKAPATNLVEATHVSHNPQFSPDLFFGRMKKSDK